MPEKETLLKVENLKMYFPAAKSVFGKTTSCVKAVDDVSFEVEKGKTFGLVGESGCGKTTTGKCILRINTPTEGHIYYKGMDLSRASKDEIKSIRREIQLIFQDPYGSLDPRQSAYSIIKEGRGYRQGKIYVGRRGRQSEGTVGDRGIITGNGRPVST